MMKRRVRLKFAALTCFMPAIFVSAAIADDEPPVAVSIRLIQPDAQLDRFLKLFEGARYPHPAAAFAAWKRAKMLDRDRPEPFSKGLEVLIAFFNPEMVRELKTLDDGRFCLRFAAETGRAAWSLSIPRDDGSFAAVATAFSLTDGREEEPIEGMRVDRLGPKDCADLAQKGELVVVASSRDEAALRLEANCAARRRSQKTSFGHRRDNRPGGIFKLQEPLDSTDLGRFSAVRCARSRRDRLLGRGSLLLGDRDSPCRRFAARSRDDCRRLARIRASRPDDRRDFHGDRSCARNLGRRFLGDRSGSSRRSGQCQTCACSRSSRRLTLPSRVRMEADFFPHLLGLTAISLGDPGTSRPDGFILAFHCDSLAAAKRLEIETFPRLLGGFMKKNEPRELGDVRVLGEISNRSVSIARRERTVLLSWGDPRTTMSACLAVTLIPNVPPVRSFANLGSRTPLCLVVLARFGPARSWRWKAFRRDSRRSFLFSADRMDRRSRRLDDPRFSNT